MLETLKRALQIEDFPEITFILAAIMLAVFLFTSNTIVTPTYKSLSNNTCTIVCPNTCTTELGNQLCAQADYSSCNCVLPRTNLYENIFGFIPAHPQIYALTTYIFIHDNFTHIFFNLIFLIVAGIAIEETLGAVSYLAIFLASAYFAVMFDIMGRFITGYYNFMTQVCVNASWLKCVNLDGPFVGASGAIFGVMAVASMIRPTEKIPTILVLIALVPFAQIYYQYFLYPQSSPYDFYTNVFISVFLAIIALTIFSISPVTVPIIVGMMVFLLSWIFVIFLGIGGDVSNVGHLGGVIGGIVSYFLFAKIKRT